MTRLILLGVLLALTAGGCAPAHTKFKDTWKRPGYSGKAQKVYIIGVTRNDRLRRTFENELASQFYAHGVTGVPSHPDLVISGNVDREALRARLRAQGTDTVLVARLAGKEQRTAAFSAREAGYGIGTGPLGVYYDEFYNGSIEMVAPGPAVESDYSLVSISVNLFETESAQAVWSTLTETTITYDNKEERLREFAQAMAARMHEQGLF